VEGLTIGTGKLGGRGVYAARDFAAGEVVVPYELQPLSRAEFEALPPGEDMFVHSYGGKRWLYPPPARWVNHADDPSCYEDFDSACDVALRDITAGEAITIDAAQETDRELSTFIAAYVDARGRAAIGDLYDLIDPAAVLWRAGCAARGADAFVAALADGAGPAKLEAIEWLVGTGRWDAVCSAQATHEDAVRHTTIALKVIAGNWQVIYEHEGSCTSRPSARRIAG
jgi:hypothetical protein